MKYAGLGITGNSRHCSSPISDDEAQKSIILYVSFLIFFSVFPYIPLSAPILTPRHFFHVYSSPLPSQPSYCSSLPHAGEILSCIPRNHLPVSSSPSAAAHWLTCVAIPTGCPANMKRSTVHCGQPVVFKLRH
jgi:hypothetical protein